MRRLGMAACLSLSLVCLVLPARGADSFAIHEAGRPDGAEIPSNVVAATFDSTAWLSLDLVCLRRVSLPWPHKRILVGAGLDVPLILWFKTGEPDTFRFSVRGSAEVLRARWFALVVDLKSRLGVQDSVLNTSVGWDFQLNLAPSLVFELQ